jgi:hypothetical protein
MLFDKKGKLFGKISIVDILIVVIIIAVIGGVYYKFGKSGTVTAFTKTDKIQMSFVSESIPNYIVNSIKVGDVAKDRVQNVVVGKVVNIAIGADKQVEPNSEGVVVMSSRPDYCSVTITVEGQGIYGENGSTFGGVEYYVNKPGTEMRFGNSFFYAKVSEIKKMGEK